MYKASASLHVMFLSTSMGLGGADRQVLNLALRLRARGHMVRIISLVPPGPIGEEARQLGLYMGSLGMRRGVPDPRALFRLVRALRRERPQILHSHMVHANLLARLARPFASVPIVVCTVHSIREGGRQREFAYRLTDLLCDVTTQVSRAGLARYVRIGAVPAQKIRFIPNGVDTIRFRPDRDARARVRKELGISTEFVWLAVGRFEEAKDYPNLLRAFARVREARPDARLLIAGQGSLKADAERLAVVLGLTDTVRFLGVWTDIPGLMNAADAYVMASAWEGMPMVLLEAAAVGLPVVATNVGGNCEVVLDGQTGFLVPPKDPTALAQAMLRLMDTPLDSRVEMGHAGRRHVEAHYALDRVVDQWETLYREFLLRKGIVK